MNIDLTKVQLPFVTQKRQLTIFDKNMLQTAYHKCELAAHILLIVSSNMMLSPSNKEHNSLPCCTARQTFVTMGGKNCCIYTAKKSRYKIICQSQLFQCKFCLYIIVNMFFSERALSMYVPYICIFAKRRKVPLRNISPSGAYHPTQTPWLIFPYELHLTQVVSHPQTIQQKTGLQCSFVTGSGFNGWNSNRLRTRRGPHGS